MIEVEGLSFEYPAKRALDQVNFRIEAGTVTALVGPNGAGKTTLLRCLATLEVPYAGTIRLDGIDAPAEPRRARRLLGFLDEFFGLYDDLTVLQCLRYWAGAHGIAGDAVAAATDAAERLGLADRLGERAGSLSRGLRQRLAIAQAIIHRPRILLMDEPASGLDPEARASLAGLIHTLQAGGMTIIVSSHILSELEDYSTHMLIVDQGRIVDHAPLRGGRQTAAMRHLRLKLAGPDQRLADALAALPGVSGLTATSEAANFDFAGDLAAQAAFLRHLVGEGLAIATLEEAHGSLQDRYLEKVKAARP